jgi:hypothetical protein
MSLIHLWNSGFIYYQAWSTGNSGLSSTIESTTASAREGGPDEAEILDSNSDHS